MLDGQGSLAGPVAVMKCKKTESEQAFEAFLIENNLCFEKVQEAETRRPDYKVHANNEVLIFEVKELAADEKYGVVLDPTRLVHSIVLKHPREPRAPVHQFVAGSSTVRCQDGTAFGPADLQQARPTFSTWHE